MTFLRLFMGKVCSSTLHCQLTCTVLSLSNIMKYVPYKMNRRRIQGRAIESDRFPVLSGTRIHALYSKVRKWAVFGSTPASYFCRTLKRPDLYTRFRTLHTAYRHSSQTLAGASEWMSIVRIAFLSRQFIPSARPFSSSVSLAVRLVSILSEWRSAKRPKCFPPQSRTILFTIISVCFSNRLTWHFSNSEA